MTVTIREVTDPGDPAIEGFGRMQSAAYFAPEMLIPAPYIPRLLAAETRTHRNFLIVAEADGRVVGGTLFHWLASAGSGFSSFLGVARAWRGQGLARQLHVDRFRILDRAAGGRVPGVFIDALNPQRMSAEELEHERRAGSDPWDRRRALERLGFGQVAIRYEQPVGRCSGDRASRSAGSLTLSRPSRSASPSASRLPWRLDGSSIWLRSWGASPGWSTVRASSPR